MANLTVKIAKEENDASRDEAGEEEEENEEKGKKAEEKPKRTEAPIGDMIE